MNQNEFEYEHGYNYAEAAYPYDPNEQEYADEQYERETQEQRAEREREEERQRFHDEHMVRADDGTEDRTPLRWTSVQNLMRIELPPIKYIVAGLLPQGLALLASPPKYGKSWLVLDLCLSVAAGKPFLGRETEQCDTLYLALEDSPKRLQTRMQTILGDEEAPFNMVYGTETGTIGDRLLHHLEVHLRRYPNTGLIVIDTFQKVRDMQKRSASNIYANDYADVSALKAFADEHDLCVLLVHHLRKAADSGDPFARISGTNGILGAADTALVMTRDERSDSTTRLSSTGRDVLAEDLEMQFDNVKGRWHVIENKAARTAEERYRADPLVQTAERLVRENPAGWQGTATELSAWVKEFTGISLTALSLSKQMRNMSDNLRRYDNIIYTPPTDSSHGQRLHTLYKVPCPSVA